MNKSISKEIFKMPEPYDGDADFEDTHFYQWLKGNRKPNERDTDIMMRYLESHGFDRDTQRVTEKNIRLYLK